MKTRILVGAICFLFLMMAVPVSGNTGETQSGWQTPMPIGWYDASMADKAVAINPAGEMLAVMVMTRASNDYVIVASHCLPGDDWSQLSDVSSAIFPIYNLKAVADGAGNFWVTYSIQMSSTLASLDALKFNHTTGWSNWSSLQYQSDYGVGNVVLSADSVGNVMVAWVKMTTSAPWTYEIMAQRFTAASGWGTATLVRASSANMPNGLSLSTQSSGSAAVAWVEFPGSSSSLRTSRYVPNFGWSDVEVLTTQPTNVALVGIGFSEQGVGLIAWSQGNNPREVYTRSYSNSAWQPAVLAASDPQMAFVRFAVNSVGQAMLTWTNESYGHSMKCATFTPAQGWATSTAVFQIEASLNFIFASLHLASNGHALLVYEKGDGPADDNGFFSRGFAISTWGPETLIAPPDVYAYEPIVSFGSQGMAVLCWNIMVMNHMTSAASVYIPSHMPAPSLNVISPTSGSTSSTGTVHVIGVTDIGAQVNVNGIDAFVSNTGIFDIIVPLNQGENVLTITATGAYGNGQSTAVTVKYVDAAQQKTQNDINNLSGQGTMYLLLGLVALIVAIVAIVLLLRRKS